MRPARTHAPRALPPLSPSPARASYRFLVHRARPLERGDFADHAGSRAEATGCAVDPAAIAEAARLLDRALATNPDLLVVNRFGRLESEGGGMLAEIGRAFAEGVAMIVCVPERYRDVLERLRLRARRATAREAGGDRSLVARSGAAGFGTRSLCRARSIARRRRASCRTPWTAPPRSASAATAAPRRARDLPAN